MWESRPERGGEGREGGGKEEGRGREWEGEEEERIWWSSEFDKSILP